MWNYNLHDFFMVDWMYKIKPLAHFPAGKAPRNGIAITVKGNFS